MTCESCGAEATELASVQRMYVLSAEGERTERVLADVERWCVSCLTQYPHVPADG